MGEAKGKMRKMTIYRALFVRRRITLALDGIHLAPDAVSVYAGLFIVSDHYRKECM